MHRIIRFVTELFLLATLGVPLAAQTSMVDHWSSAEQALAATSSPFYYPTLRSQQKLEANEVVWGHPTGGVFDMKLPDRLGNRGWVRIQAGRQFVYNRDTGKVLRLAECNNTVYGWEPFPPIQGLQGPPGPQGPRGYDGRDGRDGRDADFTRREALRENLGPVVTKPRKWPWVVGTLAVITVGILASRHHGGDNNGTPPGGNTGPAH